MTVDGGNQALRILVVNPDVPPVDRDSGSLRLFRIIEALRDAGHSVSLLARAGIGERQAEAAEALLAIGVAPVWTFDLERAAAIAPGWAQFAGALGPLDVAGLLRDGCFDLAWLSFFHVAEQYTPLIRAHSPATRIVVDSVDIHHVREARGAQLERNAAALAAASGTRERERAAYSAADANVAVSEADAAQLSALAPDVPAYVVPNIHPVSTAAASPQGRHDILFVGNFRHAPNEDAVLWFCSECWPIVHEALPQAHLRIVGTAPPAAFTQISAPQVTVEGWVPSVEPYLERARVSIAPLRFGSGVKGKIGEAIACGVPVVTTSIGSEGMGLVHREHALVADTAEDFASCVVELFSDEHLWGKLSASARSLLAQTMDVEVARAALGRILEQQCLPRWQAPGDAPWLAELLSAYKETFGPGDHALLVLTYPPAEPQAGEAIVARVTELAEQLSLDLDSMADIEVTAWHEKLAVPARTVFWRPGATAA